MQFKYYTQDQKDDVIALYEQTFGASEGEAEGKVIGELVNNMLTNTPETELIPLLALDNDALVGAIIFSKLYFTPTINAYILSPVAVSPRCQGKGVGQGLINFGLEQLQQGTVELVFTYGDPNYYSKVGFQQITEAQIPAPAPMSHPEGWLCQSLTESGIPTVIQRPSCIEALSDPSYW